MHETEYLYSFLQVFQRRPENRIVMKEDLCDNLFFGMLPEIAGKGRIAMRIIEAVELVEPVRRLCLRACCDLPADVTSALETARANEQEGGAARFVLGQLVENQRLAREKQRPICQDTGMAVVFADIGRDAHIEGDLTGAVNEGVRLAYTDGYLRKSVLDPLTRVNTGDNTPAVLHIRLVDGDRVHLAVAPKGFGSENMSRLWMLPPSAGVEGILEAIVTSVKDAGASACPPVVVGVGIGGTTESCALLAKRQLLRSIGERSAREDVAAIEREAFLRINASGGGPMGYGGSTSALAVLAAAEPTHIAGLPVAVNLQCHACRHAACEV